MASPNLAVDLCTLADVTAYIGGDLTASAGTLQQLITAISSAAATYCGHNFIQATYTEACDGTGTSLLLPHNQPITAVTSLYDGSRQIKAGVAGGTVGFVFDSECVYLLCGARFCRGYQNIVLTYTAGYTDVSQPTSTIPADLREAIVEAVADRFKKRQLIGIQSKTIAGETITYTSKDFPSSVKLILGLYQKVSFG